MSSHFLLNFFLLSLFLGGGWRFVACGILVPWSGIQPTPSALEAQSLSHWTTREVSLFILLKHIQSQVLRPAYKFMRSMDKNSVNYNLVFYLEI